MQPLCFPTPEGITNECKCSLVNFVTEGSSPLVARGWLICLLSSPPVIVAATASGQDAASDLQVLRSCLPIGLVVAGCWQFDDGDAALSVCARMWKESAATGTGMHLGVAAGGALSAAVPIVPHPESRLLSICFSPAVATAIDGGAQAAFLICHNSELVQPGILLVSDLKLPTADPSSCPVCLMLTCRVTIPVDVPKPSPALIKAGEGAKFSAQLQQQPHTIAAYVSLALPLERLVHLLLVQAAAVSATVQSSRHEILQFNLPGWLYRVNICVPEAPSSNPGNEGEEDEEVVVVKPQDDKELHWLQQRLQLHALFGLPLTRPVFRTALSINESASLGANGKLVNVHLALTPPVIQGAKDRENDKGWGCAYRSLQSVWSWFRLQGYTSRPPPSILDIQKSVVATGFRPKSLIGSRDWIGSIEVGAVLDQELPGCSHKILNLSSGHELDSHEPCAARDLVGHFTRVGTPITTGGGELAHTMLGICANLDTGETRYLMMDPHYTGVDDEKSVVKGKGCQWVDKNFFDKRAFLNLCLPQPPQEQ